MQRVCGTMVFAIPSSVRVWGKGRGEGRGGLMIFYPWGRSSSILQSYIAPRGIIENEILRLKFHHWTPFFLKFINAGIISLCRPDGKGVQSLLGVFCLPSTDVRVSFLKLFPYCVSSVDGEKYIVLVNVLPFLFLLACKVHHNFLCQCCSTLSSTINHWQIIFIKLNSLNGDFFSVGLNEHTKVAP